MADPTRFQITPKEDLTLGRDGWCLWRHPRFRLLAHCADRSLDGVSFVMPDVRAATLRRAPLGRLSWILQRTPVVEARKAAHDSSLFLDPTSFMADEPDVDSLPSVSLVLGDVDLHLELPDRRLHVRRDLDVYRRVLELCDQVACVSGRPVALIARHNGIDPQHLHQVLYRARELAEDGQIDGDFGPFPRSA